jgi:amino acid permease
MNRVRIRPLTILLVIVAIAFAVLGIVYFATAAKDLPSFFPGHAARSTRHHLKHGIAMIVLALVALGGAWFTTAAE